MSGPTGRGADPMASGGGGPSAGERPRDQLDHLRADLTRAVNGRWWRWVSVPCSPGMLSIVGYRFSRAMYLRLGDNWSRIHTLLAPLRVLTRPFAAGLELHYRAHIGPGLLVLHPNLGAVVGGEAHVGSGVILTGGNCIAGARGTHGSVTIGDRVSLGVNAVVLGPAVVGDRVVIGAGAVVVGDAAPGTTMVGVPARVSGHAKNSASR